MPERQLQRSYVSVRAQSARFFLFLLFHTFMFQFRRRISLTSLTPYRKKKKSKSTLDHTQVPELNGRLTASAIRVPTPDVSILVMNLKLSKKTTVDSVKKVLHEMSCTALSDQIDFVDSPEAASSDFVGNSHASIVDSKNLIVKDDQAVLYVWYDNEYGYSCQTYRLLRKMCL